MVSQGTRGRHTPKREGVVARAMFLGTTSKQIASKLSTATHWGEHKTWGRRQVTSPRNPTTGAGEPLPPPLVIVLVKAGGTVR